MKNVALILLVVVSTFSACKKEDQEALDTNDANNTKRAIAFEVITYKETEVKYWDEKGESHVFKGVDELWEKEIKMEIGSDIIVYGYNTSDEYSSITLKVFVDGSLLKERTVHCPISGFVSIVEEVPER